jgi:hypothetical protein
MIPFQGADRLPVGRTHRKGDETDDLRSTAALGSVECVLGHYLQDRASLKGWPGLCVNQPPNLPLDR